MTPYTRSEEPRCIVTRRDSVLQSLRSMFLPSTKLLVLGNVAVDETYAVRRLPTPGKSILAYGRARDLGGKGANQAIVAARDGCQVHPASPSRDAMA